MRRQGQMEKLAVLQAFSRFVNRHNLSFLNTVRAITGQLQKTSEWNRNTSWRLLASQQFCKTVHSAF